jgi:hypothetical protein
VNRSAWIDCDHRGHLLVGYRYPCLSRHLDDAQRPLQTWSRIHQRIISLECSYAAQADDTGDVIKAEEPDKKCNNSYLTCRTGDPRSLVGTSVPLTTISVAHD